MITFSILAAANPAIGFAQTFPASDPDDAGGWVLNSSVSDEFDATQIDSDKWLIQGTDGEYANNFKGRAPSQFVPDNVSIRDGHLRITTKWQPSFSYLKESFNGQRYANITTGAIISKKRFHYGYLETRCKAANGPVSSSFWTTGKRGELDVFEHWGKNTKSEEATQRYHSSFHDWRSQDSPTWGKRIWTNTHRLDFHVGEEFHVYGFEWAKDYIRIYIDGGLIRTVTREEIGDAWVVDDEQKVWLDSEVFPWEVNPGTLGASDFPGDGLAFEVDYVRVWQRTADADVDLTESRTNLLSNGSFESGLSGWDPKGRSNGKHKPKASADESAAEDGDKSAFLESYCVLEQPVKLKPRTTYILSGWLSLPGTESGRVHHAAFGVKRHGGQEVRAKSTASDFTRHSLQFTTGENNETATVFFTNDQKSNPARGDRFELYEQPRLTPTSPRSEAEDSPSATRVDFWDPIPSSPSTTMPEGIQDGYWHGQFQRVNREIAAAKETSVVFFGDSITLNWSHGPGKGKEVWSEYFSKYRPMNMGNSGDITPVMLYRARHGNLDFPEGQQPKVAVLLCGTNNFVVTKSAGGKVEWDLGAECPPEDVANGVRAIAQEFRRRLPQTRLIVMGILPVANEMKRANCRQVNEHLNEVNFDKDNVVYVDLWESFVNSDGSLRKELFTDGTHLTTAGYRVWAEGIESLIADMVSEKAN